MADEPIGGHDEIANPLTLDAAAREALDGGFVGVVPDTGFFSLSDDPDWLDPELQRRYVGMREDRAASAAEQTGIRGEIRVLRLPFRSALSLDQKPDRLNFAVTEGRVIRAAFL